MAIDLSHQSVESQDPHVFSRLVLGVVGFYQQSQRMGDSTFMQLACHPRTIKYVSVIYNVDLLVDAFGTAP